jgi:hypothetical protein
MQNPDTARKRAQLGLDAVERDFTWDTRARRILDFMDEAA